LRLTPGESITLLDGAGGQWSASLVEVGRRRVVARRGERLAASNTEPILAITLFQGVLKAARFEWVLQKGTELGVSTFVPLLSEHVVAGSEATGPAKRTRWLRLLEEATEQCGRTRVPHLAEPCTFARALLQMPPDTLALIPWEGEHSHTLRDGIQDHLQRTAVAPAQAHVFIGPEGGFAADEIAFAARQGAVPVTLGPRILRAETAAIAAIVLLLDACGEMR
jgi:16S rRNA (uracil1498-N3)-methyltransferase